MGWVVSATPRPLYPWERPGTHCTGGWVGHRAGLDGCGKFRPHRNSIPGPSNPYRVAIPTELSRPILLVYTTDYKDNAWKVQYQQPPEVLHVNRFDSHTLTLTSANIPTAGNCALLSHYAASGGNFLPTFWDNLSVLSSGG